MTYHIPLSVRLLSQANKRMVKFPQELSAGDQAPHERPASWLPSLASFRHQLRWLRWLIPIILMVLVIVYEVAPARWIYYQLDFTYHMLMEILIFGTVGPALAFILLELLRWWLDERDTSDFQSQLLAQARQDADKSSQLGDDALQVLFSAGTLLSTFKSDQPELAPETVADIEAVEQALDEAIQHLRSHLQNY